MNLVEKPLKPTEKALKSYGKIKSNGKKRSKILRGRSEAKIADM